MRDLGLGQLEEVLTTHDPFHRDSGPGDEMTKGRVFTIRILCAGLGTSLLCAGDLSHYREFTLGMSLSVAAKQAGMKRSEARLVHQRPPVIQELEWLPRNSSGSPFQADPVKEGLLCFYNGELFRMVITYDRYKVEGMTASDMIQAISATYGIATRPAAQIPYHSVYGEVAQVIARWEDSEYSYNLVESGDRSSFALILYSRRLQTLAEATIVEAVPLDAQKVPPREVELPQKKEEESRVLLKRARSANRPNFRP
jgi:hypothetical protein